MLMKISSDTFGNPNNELPACGAVPQPLWKERNFLTFVQLKYALPCSQCLPLPSVLLSMSAGHILTANISKTHVNTNVPSTLFPPSVVFAPAIPAKCLCVYYLSVMRATFLTHLVLDTTNCVFRPPRHWLLFFPKFFRNVCNHLPSNVASYHRRNIRLFTQLWKIKNSSNCMNLSSN